MLEFIVSLILGWNLVTVPAPVHPQAFVNEHQCVESIWWYDGGWNLWDTSESFTDSDFFIDLRGWEPEFAQGAWLEKSMTPDHIYWVYCE